MSIAPYAALALQMRCDAVNGCNDVSEARRQMLQTIARCDGLIRGSKGFLRTFAGQEIRLVVLPEYFMTGFPMGESVSAWIELACIEENGPEYQALAQVARAHNVYLSGNVYELDPHFPGLYFQTSFILADTGERVLRYRRLLSMFSPTPHDVLERYVEVYGEESLFPVADTELGKLACVASEEILYPEISRALALRGAEVICHSSSEVGSPLATPKNIAKQARALENMAYLVSANSAGIAGIAFPEASTDGHSQVVDYKGRLLAEAGPGESMVGCAELDVAALRRARATPAMGNLLARQRLDLFASTYSDRVVHPPNTLLDPDNGAIKVPDRTHFMDTQREAIARLREPGK